MFGGLEAGRGIVTLLVTTVFLGVYAVFQADSAKAMSAIVITCSLVMILGGRCTGFFDAEDQRRRRNQYQYQGQPPRYGKSV